MSETFIKDFGTESLEIFASHYYVELRLDTPTTGYVSVRLGRNDARTLAAHLRQTCTLESAGKARCFKRKGCTGTGTITVTPSSDGGDYYERSTFSLSNGERRARVTLMNSEHRTVADALDKSIAEAKAIADAE